MVAVQCRGLLGIVRYAVAMWAALACMVAARLEGTPKLAATGTRHTVRSLYGWPVRRPAGMPLPYRYQNCVRGELGSVMNIHQFLHVVARV